MRWYSVVLVSVCMIATCFVESVAARSKMRAVQPGHNPGVERFLKPDGKFDLEAARGQGFEGTLDVSGFKTLPDRRTGEPVFVPRAGKRSRDPGDEYWAEGFGLPGVDKDIYAVAVYDGELVVAGWFDFAGDHGVEGLARWDGASWNSFPGWDIDWYPMTALIVHDGSLYVGGPFLMMASNGIARHVARWDGTRWYKLGQGTDDNVLCFATYDGDLVVGGVFTTAGGASANGIARWDGASWYPLDTGITGGTYTDVQGLAVWGTDLVAAGEFTHAGGNPANNIARWDGVDWYALGSGTDSWNWAVTVYDGDVIVGGHFEYAGGVAANAIARWDGLSWYPLGSGMSHSPSDPQVYTLAVVGPDLIAGGHFDTAGGTPAENIARWNGSSWSDVGSGVDNTVQGICEYGGDLIAVGGFTYAEDGTFLRYVGSWDGATWNKMGDGQGVWEYASALASFEGNLVAAGPMQAGDETISGGLTLWDGVSWTDVNPGLVNGPQPGYAEALIVYGGDLIVAGEFTEAGGVAAANIARWTGSAWYPLGSGCDNVVSALAIYDGDLVAGGDFLSAGGVSADKVARWDGSNWYALGSGIGTGFLGGSVLALAEYDGDLIAAGIFETGDGAPGDGIAGWNGSSWYPLGSGVLNGSNVGWVYDLDVYDGDLIAAGMFDSAGGVPAIGIARWDGIHWSDLGGGPPVLCSGRGLTLYRGNLIAAGGVDPLIFEWDGAAWSDLGSGMMGGGASALAVHEGALWVGGDFRIAGGKSSVNIARWNPGPFTFVVNPAGTGDYATIQAAIDAAYYGDVIELTDGTFRGAGNRDVDFLGKVITVRSQSRNPEDCIIDCEGSSGDPHRGFIFQSGEDSQSVLEGVTITGGYQTLRGGGLICFQSSPTIQDCIFTGNAAAPEGGGVGGGLECLTGSSPTIINCVFYGNSAGYGAGMSCQDSSAPTIQNCTFYDNSATDGGGGLLCNGSCSPDVINCIIASNTEEAVLCYTYSYPTLSCCDVWGNTGGDWVGCIAGQSGANGNISSDPMFCDPEEAEFTIRNDSECAPDNSPLDCGLIGARMVGCGQKIRVPSDAPTVEEAVAVAIPGDTVFVECGTHYEHDIQVPSGVLLIGESCKAGGTVIDAQGLGRVLYCANLDGSTLITGLTLTGGLGDYGGGILCDNASPTIEDCWFSDNSSQYDGGGMFCRNASSPTLTDCVFSNNTAGDDGGALGFRDSSNPILYGCTLADNSANDDGGALYGYIASPSFYNCTITGNHTPDLGSALCMNNGGSATLENTIVAFNTDGEAIACVSSNAALTCCDVYGNAGGDYTGCLAGQSGVDGNFSDDPLFCNAASGDYSLDASSLCLPDNNPACGLVGADTLGCGLSTVADQTSRSLPRTLTLGSAVPNPFNPVTEITYGVPAGNGPSRVTLNIYDALGRRVATLVDEDRAPGSHSVTWNGTDRDGSPVASGAYFYRITWMERSETKRMVLLK